MKKLITLLVVTLTLIVSAVTPASATIAWTATALGTLPSPYSAQSAIEYGGWSGQILETNADGTRLITSDSASYNSGQPNTNRYVYLSSDSGQTWTNSGLPAGWWGPVASSSTGQYLAAGNYGLGGQGGGPLYTSADYGATWRLSSAGNKYWWNIKMSADGSFMIASYDHAGVPYVSYDFGSTWAALAGFTSGQWRDLGVSSDGKVVAVCNNDRNATNNGARIFISRSGAVPTDYSSFTETIDQASGVICGAMDMAGAGDRLVSSSYSTSKSWIWRFSSGAWSLVTELAPPVDWPTAPAISADGLKILVPCYGQEHDYYSTDGGVTFETLTRTDLATKVGNASLTPDGSKIFQIATDKVYSFATGASAPQQQNSNSNVMVQLAPTTYLNGVIGNKAIVGQGGTVTLLGAGFKSVKLIKVGGESMKIVKVADESVEFEIPTSLAVGSYSIALTGDGLNFTYQDGLLIADKPVIIKATVKTITCVKGKSTKKVSAVSPKCPTGYKQK